MTRTSRPRLRLHLFIATLLLGLWGGETARAAWAPSLPSRLNLTVRETAGVARSGEVVRSGVPMPRSLNLKSVAGFTLIDGSGARVPAEFEVTARWNAALADTTAPIQWLLVT